MYLARVQFRFQESINVYRGYIDRKETQYATGEHFDQPGHLLTNMKFTEKKEKLTI